MTEPFHQAAETMYPYVGALIPLPVIIPAVAAALSLLFARMPNVQRQIDFFSLLITAAVNASLIIIVDFHGIQTLQIGGWDAPVGITLVADRLSTLGRAVRAELPGGGVLEGTAVGLGPGGTLRVRHVTPDRGTIETEVSAGDVAHLRGDVHRGA